MGRNKQSLIYLDTHIVVWLYAGLIHKLTDVSKESIETFDLWISQMVRLELQYLYEIERIKVKPSKIIKSLSRSINLKISESPLCDIIDEALKIDWTRDVFDRVLTAEASLQKSGFITADETIRANYKQAIW